MEDPARKDGENVVYIDTDTKNKLMAEVVNLEKQYETFQGKKTDWLLEVGQLERSKSQLEAQLQATIEAANGLSVIGRLRADKETFEKALASTIERLEHVKKLLWGHPIELERKRKRWEKTDERFRRVLNSAQPRGDELVPLTHDNFPA